MKYVFLFTFGGISYYFIEILYRGWSHFSMMICGGLCFVLVGALDQWITTEISLLGQMVVGGVIITSLEFVTGIIVNRILHLNVWDYSDVPYNLYGQICLPYSMLWFLLSFVCIVLDDIIRVYIFMEPKVHYKLL